MGRRSGSTASAARGSSGVLTTATYLTSTVESPHHPGMDRRRFLLTSLAGAVAVPLAAGAQQAGKVYRIGVLLPLGETPPILARFLGGMRDLGWVENRSFMAEPRYAEGRIERL